MHIRFRGRWIILLLCITILLLLLWINFPQVQDHSHSDSDQKLENKGKSLFGRSNSKWQETRFIGIIHDETDEKIRDNGYEKHAFNELISIRIGHHRIIPDTRHKM